MRSGSKTKMHRCKMENTMNITLATDSYKLTHWKMLPKGTEYVYSYLEAREGAEHPTTLFFGLQPLLEKISGVVVTREMIEEAQELSLAHFGTDILHIEGWNHILEKHGGRIPLEIKAVPEGMQIPVGNVLMTVQNTDPEVPWLTNYVESLLMHVWYPSTVATRSSHVRKLISGYLKATTGSDDGVDFMLHDFGYRGASSHETAAIGGAAHLVSFKGTDTLPAMLFARDHYGASLDDLAFSVPASEHSVMTPLGPEGEEETVESLLTLFPTGILSVVADSFDYYGFVKNIVGEKFKDRIMEREGAFVVRPDSVTHEHTTPAELVVWTLQSLWEAFGGSVTPQGYKVLDPHVRVLWGDGIDIYGIENILEAARTAGFAASNLVFGMGGGLLQKVNRDTQRFAFKSSAQCRDGLWHDVQKKPLDITKTSKRGRLSLIEFDGTYKTVSDPTIPGILKTVFLNGEMLGNESFSEIRERSMGLVKTHGR